MTPGEVTQRITQTVTTGAVRDAGHDTPNRLLWADPTLTPPPNTSIVTGPTNGDLVLHPRTEFRYRSTAPTATFRCTLDGQALDCANTGTVLTGLSPGTHLFRVAARDDAGRTDPTPATRRFTVPYNDTALRHSPGWQRITRPDCYRGTCSRARVRGAKLSLTIERAHSIALVGTSAPGHGTAHVFLGTRLLKTVSLSADQLRRRQVFPVANFRHARTGTVTIVVGANRTVLVGGLAVTTTR